VASDCSVSSVDGKVLMRHRTENTVLKYFPSNVENTLHKLRKSGPTTSRCRIILGTDQRSKALLKEGSLTFLATKP